MLAAEWADAHLDPDQPVPGAGECLHGCGRAGREDVVVGDFNGGCAEGCVGDPTGLADPFIPVVRWDAPAFGGAIGRTPPPAAPRATATSPPLCRHHHQLKTHADWTYTVLDTGLWLWSDPHGQQFLRDRIGTTDVTARHGCRQRA